MAITAAPLTKDLRKVWRDAVHMVSKKAKANTTVYAGSLVNCVTSTGLIQPASDSASQWFAGVNTTHVTAVGGTDTPTCEVLQSGDFLFSINGSTIAQSDEGLAVFVADDNSVAKTADTSHTLACGYIVEYVDSTHAYIRIDGFCHQ